MNQFTRFYILATISIIMSTTQCAIKDTVQSAWNKVTSKVSQTISKHTTQENTNCLHHIKQYKHLCIKMDEGSITVSAWDKPHTVVQYSIKGSQKAIHNTICTESKDTDTLKYDVSYRKTNENSEKAAIDFIIRIPFDCSLNCSLGMGSIKIKNLHAPATLQTHKGFIKIKNCNGTIKATTHNGSIMLKQYDLGTTQSITLDATENITIKISPLAAAKLSAHAPNGSITSDVAVTLNQTTMLLSDEQWEERKHNIYGTINNGSAELAIKSHNGSIAINSY